MWYYYKRDNDFFHIPYKPLLCLGHSTVYTGSTAHQSGRASNYHGLSENRPSQSRSKYVFVLAVVWKVPQHTSHCISVIPSSINFKVTTAKDSQVRHNIFRARFIAQTQKRKYIASSLNFRIQHEI